MSERNVKQSASDSIAELVSKESITNTYKAQSNEKKAIVFLMNKASHVDFLTSIIDFVKFEPSNWGFSKLKIIRDMKHKRKISRIEFTEHLIRIAQHLRDNFVLVNNEEYNYYHSCMNKTQKAEYKKLFE